MLVPLLVVLLISVGVSVWSSRQRRAKLVARIREEWASTRDRPRDMEGIEDLFRSQASAASLDERTWNDLLLNDVFTFLDRTESCIGQQVLYCRLRAARLPHALGAFEALVARMAADTDARERAQTNLTRLSDPSALYVHRLTHRGALARNPWQVVFPIWTAVIAAMLVLGVVWHGFFLVALGGLVVDFGIRIATARRVGGEMVWFRQVGPLLSCARDLSTLTSEETAALTGSLKNDLVALRRLGAVARWVSRNPLTSGDLLSILLEYLNLLFLMDVNGLYLARRELDTKGPHLLRVLHSVGEIDAAIAVASFRAGARDWSRPTFVAPSESAVLDDLRHPLVPDAVPNSIALAPPSGILITGSNMSGKSTFLRTVGINVVLAQTIHTCLARTYRAPIYQLHSCIGRGDDLLAGKSYYLVEVESVLALVEASQRPEPHLFIFDELFRGTNAVERIAAGEAVLRLLIEGHKPHVTLAATHDAELVNLLRHEYVVYHLGDNIGPQGLTFDYHLMPGPARSRNAIALLKLNGAPHELVRAALERATALDERRRLLDPEEA